MVLGARNVANCVKQATEKGTFEGNYALELPALGEYGRLSGQIRVAWFKCVDQSLGMEGPASAV